MENEVAKKEYVIAFDVKNPELISVVRAFFESSKEKFPNVKIVNLFDKEDLDDIQIDNYIFENTGIEDEMSKIVDRIKKSHDKNDDLVATSVDYSDSYQEGLQKIYKLIESTGVLVNPGYINSSSKDSFGKSSEDFTEENVDNSLFYLLKQITNAYEVDKKITLERSQGHSILNEDFKISEISTSGDALFADFLNKTIESVYKSTMLKDAYTAGHVKRVSEFSKIMGRQLGLDDTQLDILSTIAMLHDTGKIITQSEVLKYQGDLRQQKEMSDAMASHAEDGGKIFMSLLANYYGVKMPALVKKEFKDFKYDKEKKMNVPVTVEREVVDVDALIKEIENVTDENGNKKYAISDNVKAMINEIYSGISEHHKDTYKLKANSDKEHDFDLVEIIEIADSFDAATSNRGYNWPKTVGEFLADMCSSSVKAQAQFNKKVSAGIISYFVKGDLAKLSPEKKQNALLECERVVEEFAKYDFRSIGEYNKDGEKKSFDELKQEALDKLRNQEEFNEKYNEIIELLQQSMHIEPYAKYKDKVSLTKDDGTSAYGKRIDVKKNPANFFELRDKAVYEAYEQYTKERYPEFEEIDRDIKAEVNRGYEQSTSLIQYEDKKGLFRFFANLFKGNMAKKKKIERAESEEKENVTATEQNDLRSELSKLTSSDEELARKILGEDEKQYTHDKISSEEQSKF